MLIGLFYVNFSTFNVELINIIIELNKKTRYKLNIELNYNFK